MVAIDGSEHSLKAAEYALEVAKSFNAQLFAVCCYCHFCSTIISNKTIINEIFIDGKLGNIALKKGGLARIRITTVTTSTTATTTTTSSTTPKLKGELRWLITPGLMKKML